MWWFPVGRLLRLHPKPGTIRLTGIETKINRTPCGRTEAPGTCRRARSWGGSSPISWAPPPGRSSRWWRGPCPGTRRRLRASGWRWSGRGSSWRRCCSRGSDWREEVRTSTGVPLFWHVHSNFLFTITSTWRRLSLHPQIRASHSVNSQI